MTVSPVKDVYDLLRTNWDNSTQSLANEPEFSTGKWSRNHKFPAVVVHGHDEGPLSGGDTGYAAYTPSGDAMQLRQGTVTIECVAGAREDLEGAASDGSDLNPKLVRDELAGHTETLLVDHTPSGSRSLAPQSANDMEVTSDEEDVSVLYLRQYRAQFIRELRPTP